MNNLPKYFHGTWVVTICLFLMACGSITNSDQPPPEAIDGVLDLREWDFEKNGEVYLSGKWAFYWDELLQPDQLASRPPASYVSVPDVWTNYDLEGARLTPKGYATYHLTLYPPDGRQTYGIYIEGEGSAYTLWVDGRLLARNGQVGTSFETMTPEKKPITVFFEPDGKTVELVMQISNFHHRKAGFRNDLLLGLGTSVHRYQMENWMVEAFSIGILFVMGLYHLFLYIFRPKNKATLYFAIICWACSIRIGVTNQSILLFHLPFIDWPLALRLEYLVFFLVPLPFALYLKTLYPQDIHRWFIWFVVGCGAGFTLFLLFSNTLALSYSTGYYQAIYIFEIIYYVYFLGRIIHKRRTGAFYIGFASLILFVAIIVETLITRNLINALIFPNILPVEQTTPFSFLAFIFVQAILLASLFSKSFARVEVLSGELEKTNISLEQSERKYRNLFEDSKDMIFIAGLDGQIYDVSPACEEVLGYPKDELIHMTLYEVIADASDGDRFREAMINQGSVHNLEFDLQRKDGNVIHTLVSATPRLDENGEIIGVQGSVRDITARKQAEVERLRALKLEEIAITDPLTKIYNRRFFDQIATKEIERAKRDGAPLALIMFDIDHFKDVNDSFGHLAGDEVLVNLARLCQQNIRSMDFLARFGGEEFVILMPDVDGKLAQEAAERLRQKVADASLVASTNLDVFISISLGVAFWNPGRPIGINELLHRADRAMYQSKEDGRNRVTVWIESDQM